MARNRDLGPDATPSQLTCGPGRLCQALGITRPAHNGLDLLDPNSPLQMRNDGMRVGQVMVTRRIGIRHAAELPLRFVLPDHSCVSGPKSLAGSCIHL
jgi:DNA-3-methyladenine glycosylase